RLLKQQPQRGVSHRPGGRALAAESGPRHEVLCAPEEAAISATAPNPAPPSPTAEPTPASALAPTSPAPTPALARPPELSVLTGRRLLLIDLIWAGLI